METADSHEEVRPLLKKLKKKIIIIDLKRHVHIQYRESGNREGMWTRGCWRYGSRWEVKGRVNILAAIPGYTSCCCNFTPRAPSSAPLFFTACLFSVFRRRGVKDGDSFLSSAPGPRLRAGEPPPPPFHTQLLQILSNACSSKNRSLGIPLRLRYYTATIVWHCIDRIGPVFLASLRTLFFWGGAIFHFLSSCVAFIIF